MSAASILLKVTVIMALALAGTRLADPSAPQKFDVVSVKPCEPAAPAAARGAGAGPATSLGSINLNCVRAASLINYAYIDNGGASGDDPIHAWTRTGGLDFSGQTPGPLKVRGGPAWVYTDRFAIEARAAGPADRSVMMGPMLRAVLEDRFRLKVHQETEQVPMWALTVGSGGPKLTRPTPGDCVELGPGVERPTVEQMNANRNARYCGRAWAEIGDAFSMRASRQSASDIATTLARDLGVKVLDRTGLDGVFNYTLEYAIDENTTLGQSYRSAPPASTAPTIFTAVEQQLGLKLIKITGPRGFLVIDRIERPGPDLLESLGRGRGAR